MDRRNFVIAALAVACVPTAARASDSKLSSMEAELRERYGEDTDEILSIAHRCILKAVEENPDLDDSEDDLELLTEIAFRATRDELQAMGFA